MRSVLLDTGPFVALLDRSEKNHPACREFLEGLDGRLLTTEAVLTETLYLLGPRAKPQAAALEFIRVGGAILVPQSLPSLSRVEALQARYESVPMDFADATLVALGEEMGVREVFTLDRRGFSVYRAQGRQAFRMWPEKFSN